MQSRFWVVCQDQLLVTATSELSTSMIIRYRHTIGIKLPSSPYNLIPPSWRSWTSWTWALELLDVLLMLGFEHAVFSLLGGFIMSCWWSCGFYQPFRVLYKGPSDGKTTSLSFWAGTTMPGKLYTRKKKPKIDLKLFARNSFITVFLFLWSRLGGVSRLSLWFDWIFKGDHSLQG